MIQEVAVVLRQCFDEPAYGVAYAGDEFIVVLPGIGKDEAVAKAEAIRTRVRETAYLTAIGREVRVSASFGVAAFPDDARDLEGIMALADQALFGSKRRGKDTVGTSG